MQLQYGHFPDLILSPSFESFTPYWIILTQLWLCKPVSTKYFIIDTTRKTTRKYNGRDNVGSVFWLFLIDIPIYSHFFRIAFVDP